jgi:hypothetical protein
VRPEIFTVLKTEIMLFWFMDTCSEKHARPMFGKWRQQVLPGIGQPSTRLHLAITQKAWLWNSSFRLISWQCTCLMSTMSTELLVPGFISHSFYPYFVPSLHVLPISCFFIGKSIWSSVEQCNVSVHTWFYKKNCTVWSGSKQNSQTLWCIIFK